MATFIGRQESDARALLATAGTRILRIEDANLDAVKSDVLGDDVVVQVLDAPTPQVEARDQGMGAWHTNPVNEFHEVTSGTGIIEFWTSDGAVSVLLEPGDIMVNISGVEHRYLPLTRQVWNGRSSGPLDAQFTGRAPGPWPAV